MQIKLLCKRVGGRASRSLLTPLDLHYNNVQFHILVVGGNSLITGFTERLNYELAQNVNSVMLVI